MSCAVSRQKQKEVYLTGHCSIKLTHSNENLSVVSISVYIFATRRKDKTITGSFNVDKMKLTKYGFRLNLLGFSSFLSVLGILVSIIGIIVGIAIFCAGFYEIGGVVLILIIPYLILWIILLIKTNKQDIPGIEKIGTVYSYVSCSLEIIGMIAPITISILGMSGRQGSNNIGYIIGSAIYIIFACLKIHAIRVENNKLLGIYLGFRYALFIFNMIASIVLSTLYGQQVVFTLIPAIVYFILDICLTVIHHSIKVDRENNADTELFGRHEELSFGAEIWT